MIRSIYAGSGCLLLFSAYIHKLLMIISVDHKKIEVVVEEYSRRRTDILWRFCSIQLIFPAKL